MKTRFPVALLVVAMLLLALPLTTGCSGLAELVTAEGIYANKNYIVETHTINIAIGFEKPLDGGLPLPKIGYWKTDMVLMAVPLDDDDALRYANERDVTIGAEGDIEIISGNRTTLDVDAQKFLEGNIDNKSPPEN